MVFPLADSSSSVKNWFLFSKESKYFSYSNKVSFVITKVLKFCRISIFKMKTQFAERHFGKDKVLRRERCGSV